MHKLIISPQTKKSISTALKVTKEKDKQIAVFKKIEKSLHDGVLHRNEHKKVKSSHTPIWKEKLESLETASVQLSNILTNILENHEDLYFKLMDNGLLFSTISESSEENIIDVQKIINGIEHAAKKTKEQFESSSGAPRLNSRDMFLDDMLSIFIECRGFGNGKEFEDYIKDCLILAKANGLIENIPEHIRKLKVISRYKKLNHKN